MSVYLLETSESDMCLPNALMEPPSDKSFLDEIEPLTTIPLDILCDPPSEEFPPTDIVDDDIIGP
jgi:hypothetical protein